MTRPMRHLDANALAQLIGSMADVVSCVSTTSRPLPSRDLPAGLGAAVDAFDAGWRPPAPAVASSLAAQVEHLAAAGMAFIEGDPATAGRLVSTPVDPSGVDASLLPPRPTETVRARVTQLATVSAAAEQAAAYLRGRQLARRAFPGVERSISAFRAFAVGHRSAQAALEDYLAVAESSAHRRQLVEELLVDASRASQSVRSGSARAVAGDEQVARLQHKAITVSDDALASVRRCVSALAEAIPDQSDLAVIHEGLQHAVDAVRDMLARAAAAELEAFDRAATPVAAPGARHATG